LSKILVAGGAGFLGSHLCELLSSSGHDLLIVDDFSSGTRTNLSELERSIRLVDSEVSQFRTDERFDAVVNLASRASRKEWETYPVNVALTNSLGNNNLINIALKGKSLYLYASSSEIYGNPATVPTSEEYLGSVSTTGSRSPYDEGKRFGESLVKAYERQHGLKSIIVRFFNTYGPRMRGDDLYGRVVDRFVKQALSGSSLTVYGDGRQTRSFTFVSDTVRAIDLLIRKGEPGSVYNVGSDRETRIIDLAELIVRLTGSGSRIDFLPLPEHDPARRAADISRMRQLGWEPMVSLEEGIRATIEHFTSSR
jgi:UDP-glucuronate decarboxylase